jgi:hypothetical protein
MSLSPRKRERSKRRIRPQDVAPPPKVAARAAPRRPRIDPADVEIIEPPARFDGRESVNDRLKGWRCPWGCVPHVTATGERVPAWWCPQWREDPAWVHRTPFDVTHAEREIVAVVQSERARSPLRDPGVPL